MSLDALLCGLWKEELELAVALTGLSKLAPTPAAGKALGEMSHQRTNRATHLSAHVRKMRGVDQSGFSGDGPFPVPAHGFDPYSGYLEGLAAEAEQATVMVHLYKRVISRGSNTKEWSPAVSLVLSVGRGEVVALAETLKKAVGAYSERDSKDHS
jgi:hypothetical protein